MLKKITAEIIGSFFLFLAIALSASAGNLAPVAIGGMLAVMVYACGHLSGAHFNPAVTLAGCLRGKGSWLEVPGYLGAQLGGMVLASLVAHFLLAKEGTEVKTAVVNMVESREAFLKIALAECMGTLALTWVILNVATAKATEGNSFYGLAIGGTVAALAFVLGPISGGAFNPAVAFAKCFHGDWAWQSLVVYACAQLMGAVVAAGLFRMTHRDETC